MIERGGRRPAIASVVGMLFMAMIFLVAIGTQAYISDAQGATQERAMQAQQRAVLRGQESVSFVGPPSGLEVTNTGPVTATAVGLLLKFENGTVVELNETSSPSFGPAVIPPGGNLPLEPLVPGGTCTPGHSTCAADYLAIVRGAAPGRELGIVTSLGNTYWYVPSASMGSNPDPIYLWTAQVGTSSLNYTDVPGLSFSGVGSAFYEVQVRIGFWQGGSFRNPDMFAIGVSNGTTFMFCGGLDWSDPSGQATELAPGNACTSASGVSLGPTWSDRNPCQLQQMACEFVGTAYVEFGPSGGTFSVEFHGIPSGEANVMADSVISAAQVG